MSIVIEPDFSIFNLISRSRQASIVLNKVSVMQKMSHKIERHIIEDQLDGYLFVGCQYFSRLQVRTDVYKQLAKHVRQVYIFGYPDVTLPTIENVTPVPLSEGDKLLKDWFVIFHSADYYTALIAQEVKMERAQRQYKCLWTFDLDIIEISCDWLASQLDVNILPFNEYDHVKHGEIMDSNLDDYLDDDI